MRYMTEQGEKYVRQQGKENMTQQAKETDDMPEQKPVTSPYQTFTTADLSQLAVYNKTDWYEIVFEGDEIQEEMLANPDSLSWIQQYNENADEGEATGDCRVTLARNDEYTNHWWTGMMTDDETEVMTHRIHNLLQMNESERLPLEEEFVVERGKCTFAFVFLGGGRLALCEKKSPQKWYVRSVGEVRARMTDAYMDCTSAGVASRAGNIKELQSRIGDIGPDEVFYTIISARHGTQLMGLTSDCLWVRHTEREIDFLFEYQLI